MKKIEFIETLKNRKYKLFRQKKELNIDLFNEGLFIFGTKDSYKKWFLFKLVGNIVNNDYNVVYITDDSYNPEVNVHEHITKNFHSKRIDLLEAFKNPQQDFESDINYIILQKKQIADLKKIGRKKFPALLNRLSKLENTVVIIDELLYQRIEEHDLIQCIQTLKESNVGLILCDRYPLFYKSIYDSLDNHLLFYLYDAPYELQYHPMILDNHIQIDYFERRELEWRYEDFSFYKHSTKEITHLACKKK